jgi:anhydro-N-acetylmuramic acid kinase
VNRSSLTVIGMLSGTSYDAVDAAVAAFELDGDTVVMRPLGMHSAPFPEDLRQRIAECLPPAATTLADVCRLDTELGRFFGQVAADARDGVAGGAADLVVSHGQTVFHWVEGQRALGTLQLGAAAWIAEATGLPVLSDVRTRDIAKGGQGAPLASTMDALLLLGDEVRRGALNLGGIANITVRGAAWRLPASGRGRPVGGCTRGCCGSCWTSRTTRLRRRSRRARRSSTRRICASRSRPSMACPATIWWRR